MGHARPEPDAADRLHRVVRHGDGLAVVFLNSLAADHRMWDEVLARLPGRATLTFDARGHGRSAVVPGDCTVSDLAADALALMRAEGIDRAVLCGLSLGGLTAMEMARIAPERVAGLALANTAVDFPPADMWSDRARLAQAQGMDELADATIERWLTPAFRAANPNRTASVRAMVAATPPDGYAACCMALASGDGRAALAGYDGPVLVLAGEADSSTPVARSDEICEAQPRAERVVLSAAHLSSVEAATAFADHLERFVSGIEEAAE